MEVPSAVFSAILGVGFPLHKPYPFSLYRWGFLHFRYQPNVWWANLQPLDFPGVHSCRLHASIAGELRFTVLVLQYQGFTGTGLAKKFGQTTWSVDRVWCVSSIFLWLWNMNAQHRGNMMWEKNSENMIMSKHMCSICMNRCKKYASLYMHENIVVSRQTERVPFCTLKSCTEKHTECSIGKSNVDMIFTFAVGNISSATPFFSFLLAEIRVWYIKVTNNHWSSWSLSKAFWLALFLGGQVGGKGSRDRIPMTFCFRRTCMKRTKPLEAQDVWEVWVKIG